jgi:hypothetical protein
MDVELSHGCTVIFLARSVPGSTISAFSSPVLGAARPSLKIRILSRGRINRNRVENQRCRKSVSGTGKVVDIEGLIIAAVVGAIVGGLGVYLLGRRRRNGQAAI